MERGRGERVGGVSDTVCPKTLYGDGLLLLRVGGSCGTRRGRGRLHFHGCSPLGSQRCELYRRTLFDAFQDTRHARLTPQRRLSGTPSITAWTTPVTVWAQQTSCHAVTGKQRRRSSKLTLHSGAQFPHTRPTHTPALTPRQTRSQAAPLERPTAACSRPPRRGAPQS